MQLIDYEKFYNNFDLELFLTEPIGKFSRDDIKLILEKFANLKSITTLASIMGLRTMLAHELLSLMLGIRRAVGTDLEDTGGCADRV